MFIFGFPIQEEEWEDNPFTDSEKSPENKICEVCHVYYGENGVRYIGIEVSLGLEEKEMIRILSSFSDDLDFRKVKE